MAPEMKNGEISGIPHGSESVLLIDDEEMVLSVSRELLEGLGYRVLTADNGKAAIAEFETKADEIDLIILDFTMPEMSGGETLKRLKSIHPKVPVLVSSGYSLGAQEHEILQHEGTGFIQKPFRLQVLAQKVREMLAS